jgi:hypothetical protein
MVESELARQVLTRLRDEGKLEPADRRRYEASYRDGDLRSLTVAGTLLATLDSIDGVWVVDVTEAFYESGKDGGLYLPRDTHWNRRGNELAAQLVSAKLREVITLSPGGTKYRPAPQGTEKSNSPAALDGSDSVPATDRAVTR